MVKNFYPYELDPTMTKIVEGVKINAVAYEEAVKHMIEHGR